MPVGFDGELISIALVLGVIAALRELMHGLKLLSAESL